MLSDRYADVLRQDGFQLIGRLNYRLELTAWWSPRQQLQLVVLNVGHVVLIRADKSYYLKSVSPDGETWARDVGGLHDFLEAHFPELRLSFFFLRDVPPALAEAEVRRRMAMEAPTLPLPTVEHIAQLQQQLSARRREVEVAENLITHSTTGPDLLTAYLREQSRANVGQINKMQDQFEGERQRLNLLQSLQREYEQKGSAGMYSFTICSNVQFADDPQRFHDAMRAVVKELVDMDRYQVRQKLNGGRLNIQIAEASEPVIAWLEMWFGATLAPVRMRQFSKEFDLLRKAAQKYMIVTPDEPIMTQGHVRHAGKHLAARVVSDFLHRLDKTEAAGRKTELSHEQLLPEAMPVCLGHRIDDAGRTLGRAVFPLSQMVHLLITGTTGSGKSYAARVLVEEAAQQEQLKIVALDPRNQSVGLLLPEDRPKIVRQYHEFGMKPECARGFDFRYFAPGLPYAPTLPDELSSLAGGRSIVSFKGLDDQDRCALAAKILRALFSACSAQESESPRLLIVVDEAQLFTRKRVDESAKQAAAESERALDTVAREGRKFGIILALASHGLKDWGFDLASIRQMMGTRIFLRNAGAELESAADMVGDGRLLAQLPSGVALVHNANWGLVRIRVRPPYSKVFELGEAEVRQLLRGNKDSIRTLTTEAQKLYAVIREHGAQPTEPLNMSRAAELADITSKRRFIELIGELEQAGAIRTKKLPERGRPRVIELVAGTADPTSDLPQHV